MTKTDGFTEFERQVEERYGVNRGLVLVVGIISVLLGSIAALVPAEFFGSLLTGLGGLLILAGVAKAMQLFLGLRSASSRQRGWPLILVQVSLDVALGVVLMNHWWKSTAMAAALLGLFLIAEGLLYLFIAIRSPNLRSLVALSSCGIITAGIGLLLAFGLVSDPLKYAGPLIGVKLITFGLSLVWIAATSNRTESSLIYGAETPVPEPGELYAVYFGTAFHLGVYIGDGQVVHYLDDNHVYQVTWNQFLDGRTPQHWTYPDLEPVPLETIKATALAEVGKTYPYSLLTFNCENFAIYCKSGGATRSSKYAQVSGGVQAVALHPLVGIVVEIHTRIVEWVAFQFGGRYGKRLSLEIRRLGAWVTAWLLARATGDKA
jgi:uncharacterized membrane protein HdeD (DUF308 family)